MPELSDTETIAFLGDPNFSGRGGVCQLVKGVLKLSREYSGVQLFSVPCPGTRLPDYRRYFELSVAPMRPDRLVVIPGSTEVLFEESREEFAAYSDSFMDYLLTMFPPQKLVFSSTLFISEDPESELNVRAGQFSDIIRAHCEAKGISYWNLLDYLLSCIRKLEPERLSTDGVTLTNLGASMLLLKVAEFLNLDLSPSSSK